MRKAVTRFLAGLNKKKKHKINGFTVIYDESRKQWELWSIHEYWQIVVHDTKGDDGDYHLAYFLLGLNQERKQ